MIENILIIDSETTGLEPTKGSKIIELAAILYNVKHKTVLQSYSTLFPCEENPVEHINNINAESTRAPMPFDLVGSIFLQMVNHSQALVAHNASFDKKFIATLGFGNVLLSKKWICTKNNFKWPMQLFRNRLQDICEAIGVPYVNAHRALADCMFLASCFNKVHDLEQRLTWAMNNANRNCYV